jgi:leader peptidase (prepilin peptidase) / N-methyltransferase
MAWAFAAAAVALAVLVALWLRRRAYRRPDDIVYRELNPWWLPVLASAAVIVAAPFYYQQPPVVLLTYMLALVWGLTLAFIDIEVRRLPDAIVLPAYPVAAALLTACSAITSDWTALLRSAVCAGAAVAGFLILALLSPRGDGLGLGDVKLAGVLGGLLGWMGWLPAVLGLLTGFVIGGVGALFLILFRRADRRSHMSFGPAMILGAYMWCVLAGMI